MTETTEPQVSVPPTIQRIPAKAPVSRTWLDRALTDLHLRICAVLTVGLFVMPVEGLPGVELCMFKRSTNLPCPGCGLTRCGANLVRGNLERAFDYNPFGLVIIPMMIGLGVIGLLPKRWRCAALRTRVTRSTTYNRTLIAFTVGFVLFGVVRSYCVFKGWDTFFSAVWLDSLP
jgi:hypothetical protein